MSDWQPIETAPNGRIVETKIDDKDGLRNQTTLKRQGNLWYFPDDSMYVYYRPTRTGVICQLSRVLFAATWTVICGTIYFTRLTGDCILYYIRLEER